MAMEEKCDSIVRGANEVLGLGLVRSISFGRKRVVLSHDLEIYDYSINSPTKKQCSEKMMACPDKSALEALPRDILIRILCCVDHDDLKRLFHVSKSIREATLIAKQLHFAYSTPRKIAAFRDFVNLEDGGEFSEVEAPNAPGRSRIPRSGLSRKKLADISVALFASPDEYGWPKRNLFMDMDTEL